MQCNMDVKQWLDLLLGNYVFSSPITTSDITSICMFIKQRNIWRVELSWTCNHMTCSIWARLKQLIQVLILGSISWLFSNKVEVSTIKLFIYFILQCFAALISHGDFSWVLSRLNEKIPQCGIFLYDSILLR